MKLSFVVWSDSNLPESTVAIEDDVADMRDSGLIEDYVEEMIDWMITALPVPELPERAHWSSYRVHLALAVCLRPM